MLVTGSWSAQRVSNQCVNNNRVAELFALLHIEEVCRNFDRLSDGNDDFDTQKRINDNEGCRATLIE